MPRVERIIGLTIVMTGIFVLVVLGPVSPKTDQANAKAALSITEPYKQEVGRVTKTRGPLTRESVFIVDRCEQTATLNLFNCAITNDAEVSGWKFSTRSFPKGTKVVIVSETRKDEGTDLTLIEPLTQQEASALGVN